PRPAAATSSEASPSTKQLHGRFLHITDFHPDPFYKTYSSTEDDSACHRSQGPAGFYGAETTDCDAPLSLINATFKWIDENIKDDIDFIVWTGDSARHDNDELIPRSDKQVIEQNEMLVDMFREVWGRGNDDDGNPWDDFKIPIIPTFGNNDILPHNIFREGPNRWTGKYLDIWRSFIPEEQRHQFQRGGWFYVEAIPNKLAVFSLNTLYFFDSNSATDGCAAKTQPGYEHMEWLRIQLQILRQRGMKAILTGHVPPARTNSKRSWDETCWQKYTFWMQQYRDVVIASLYGHMNIDHFMLQDFKELSGSLEKGIIKNMPKANMEHDFTTQGASDYLMDLRDEWAKLPTPSDGKKKKKGSKSKSIDSASALWQRTQEVLGFKPAKKDKGKYFEEIGGKYGERYSSSFVGPSVIPNYYPTLRIFEYNTTAIDTFPQYMPSAEELAALEAELSNEPLDFSSLKTFAGELEKEEEEEGDSEVDADKKKKKKKKKHHRKYRFTVPNGPSKSAPPGPAYSPQTLSLLGYTQYFANLTTINNDTLISNRDDVGEERWKSGKHHGKKPKRPEPHPEKFEYEVEYDTRSRKDEFRLKDLTMRSYMDLAARIGKGTGKASVAEESNEHEDEEDDSEMESDDSDSDSEDEDEVGPEKKKDKKKKKKHHKKGKKGKKNELWYTFVKRAFVGTLDPKAVEEQFGRGVVSEVQQQSQQ
ncbi:Endopolyphosphatase, partial [Saccharata proteae CBS 121410]